MAKSKTCGAQTSKMNQCPNTKDVNVFGKNVSEQTAIIFRPRCKQWSCDYCAEMNKDYWIQQSFRGATIILNEGRELQFVTLTSRPYATPTQSLWFFKQNWPKLNRRAKYHTEKWKDYAGKVWSYFLVPERHKSGVLHAHIICATHIAHKKFWKDWAHETGFGYIVDVQQLADAGGASAYVSKYLHKGMGAEQWPPGFMRVRHSRNWPIVPDAPLAGWEWETYANEDTVWLEKNALLNMGWEVLDKR
jgi:hypothetical protein